MVLSSILINPISIFASESNVYSSNNTSYMQQVDSTTKAEIQKLTSKVYPYLKTNEDGSFYILASAKEIGITESELADIKRGLTMVTCENENSVINPRISSEITSYGRYIRISVTDIKKGLTYALITGAAIAMAGALGEAVGVSIGGIVFDLIVSLAWVWIDMEPTTVYFPNKTIDERYGFFYIYNSKSTYQGYWIFS